MNATLTIVYAGKVAVFDNFPADKAHELMAYASKSISQNHQNNTESQSRPSFPLNLMRTSTISSTPIVPRVNIIPSTGTSTIHEHRQVSFSPTLCGNFLIY